MKQPFVRQIISTWKRSSGLVFFASLFLVALTARAEIGTPAAASPAPLRLQNISARAQVRTGDDVLIGGVIISGNQPKQVLFRAIGPSLAIKGTPVPGRMADTTLTLYRQSDGSIIATNDNWKDTQQSAIAATGKQPGSDLDSAILATLDPGNYTTVLRGKNGLTGIALVEAYELDSTDTKLMNVSARGVVEGGDNVLIAGFIVGSSSPGGSGELAFMVRAIGPTLADYGIANPIRDPILQLFDENGNVIASNDDWRTGPFIDIERTGLAPKDERESVIFGSITPGAYTAIMRGKDQATGTGLVEVYDESSFVFPQ